MINFQAVNNKAKLMQNYLPSFIIGISVAILPISVMAAPYGAKAYGTCVYGQNKTADINLDCKVDIKDFSIMTSRWGSADTSADLNHNGSVDVYDLTILINSWEG